MTTTKLDRTTDEYRKQVDKLAAFANGFTRTKGISQCTKCGHAMIVGYRCNKCMGDQPDSQYDVAYN